jgi:hypothetical protein
MPQRSEEWEIARWGLIGGTLSGKLGSDTIFDELLSCMIEEWQPEDTYVNAAMQRGIDLEPFGLQEFAQANGLELITPGWIECTDAPLLGLSPDATTADYRTAVELKCPGAKNHTKYLREGGVPLEYVSQLIQYFTVIDTLEVLHFLSYRPESIVRFHHVELTRNSEINVGTEKKPIMLPIHQAVEHRIDLANDLKTRLDEAFANIVFKS